MNKKAGPIPSGFIGKPKNYPEQMPWKEVKRRFSKLLGRFEPPSTPLKLKVKGEIKLPGNVIKQRVEYFVEPGEKVPALHVFRKDIPQNAPGILAIHAHGGGICFAQGKEMHCKPDPKDPKQYTYRLALEGFRVLTPDALCFGERRTSWGYSTEFFDEINKHMEMTARGESFCRKSLWDNFRAIEVLELLGAKIIGSAGHSGGSTQNYILTSINNKVKAAVCFASFATLRHQFYQYRLAHCLYHFVPGMIKMGIDWDQVVALAAPRKFLFCAGGKDEGTPEPMLRAFVQAINKRCREEKLPRSVYVCREPSAGHAITENMMQRAIDFLKENLMVQ
jgi:dienelactone hydrolase